MMTHKTSHYLNFIIPRLEGLMSDYQSHRMDMMHNGLSGWPAIEHAQKLADQIAETLADIAWHIEQGYEPITPLPEDILEELKQRRLI